ncbi:heavy metal translocating P-type ATPase [Enterovirga sp. CN4-39]|uniref:heavy metal translocating P-type ATPase n=1 Tax=Enterovirga sp. CN4-39 TaxID=3400910 RepID=UPI003C090E34
MSSVQHRPPISGRHVLRLALIAVALAGLAGGLAAQFLGEADWAAPLWTAGTVPVLAALLVEIVSSLRRGELGLDIVAALSMTVALIFGEALAAAVVALMYAGGQALEAFAERRATRSMTALLERMPRTAMRYVDGRLETVQIDAVVPGDRLLVRRGEMVPVDGTVESGVAVLDLSAITGETLPARVGPGGSVLSGATNAGDVFDLTASLRAADSTYAAIVAMIEAAQRSKAAMSRLADRFAMVFLAATIALAGGAWFWTGEPTRGLAVLVVATPCPLILAVPVAIVCGIARAARVGILVKGGRALETLSRVRTVVLDKTGTLTHGTARLVGSDAAAGWSGEDVLRLAASLDQASSHVTAQALVAAAHEKGLRLSVPSAVIESPGEGLAGEVDGRAVVVGGPTFVGRRSGAEIGRSGSPEPGASRVAVAVDGSWAGTLIFADALRSEAVRLLAALRSIGIRRIVVASGDRREVVKAVTAGLPVDLAVGELTPEDKLAAVKAERNHGPVMMVGDGVNDAPALAAADLGVALGARGAAASAQAADVVILVDELDRLLPAITIARNARHIALQSVWAGLLMSGGGMIAAAFGYLTPVQGALIQEVIDVIVILNALRALKGDETTSQAGAVRQLSPTGTRLPDSE